MTASAPTTALNPVSVPFDSPSTIPYHSIPRRADYVRRWHRDARRNRRAEYLADKCCIHCGAGSFLEIHHRDPNQKVDHRHIWHWSQKRREEELAKCDVLCDACHGRTVEYSKMLRRGWYGGRVGGFV